MPRKKIRTVFSSPQGLGTADEVRIVQAKLDLEQSTCNAFFCWTDDSDNVVRSEWVSFPLAAGRLQAIVAQLRNAARAADELPSGTDTIEDA